MNAASQPAVPPPKTVIFTKLVYNIEPLSLREKKYVIINAWL